MKKAKCRGCGMNLVGRPYEMGGTATHPTTGRPCPVNYYGGFVCSEVCDYRACLELEQSMPGHGIRQTRVGVLASNHTRKNWRTP